MAVDVGGEVADARGPPPLQEPPEFPRSHGAVSPVEGGGLRGGVLGGPEDEVFEDFPLGDAASAPAGDLRAERLQPLLGRLTHLGGGVHEKVFSEYYLNLASAICRHPVALLTGRVSPASPPGTPVLPGFPGGLRIPLEGTVGVPPPRRQRPGVLPPQGGGPDPLPRPPGDPTDLERGGGPVLPHEPAAGEMAVPDRGRGHGAPESEVDPRRTVRALLAG